MQNNGTDQSFVKNDKVFGLDTDCVHGKLLTRLLLPAFQFITLPSRGNLGAQVPRSYQRPHAITQKPVFSCSAQDDLSLMGLIEQVRQVNENLLACLHDELIVARAEAGKGEFANLIQPARLNKLDLKMGRKILVKFKTANNQNCLNKKRCPGNF